MRGLRDGPGARRCMRHSFVLWFSRVWARGAEEGEALLSFFLALIPDSGRFHVPSRQRPARSLRRDR